VIVLYAVLFSTQRGATIGRPEGSSPLGRLALEITLRGMRPEPPCPVTGTQHAFTSNQHAAASIFSPLAAAGAGGMHPVINAATAPWADVAAT
jgi:hypothetical protein